MDRCVCKPFTRTHSAFLCRWKDFHGRPFSEWGRKRNVKGSRAAGTQRTEDPDESIWLDGGGQPLLNSRFKYFYSINDALHWCTVLSELQACVIEYLVESARVVSVFPPPPPATLPVVPCRARGKARCATRSRSSQDLHELRRGGQLSTIPRPASRLTSVRSSCTKNLGSCPIPYGFQHSLARS